jgi:hypothetical protein
MTEPIARVEPGIHGCGTLYVAGNYIVYDDTIRVEAERDLINAEVDMRVRSFVEEAKALYSDALAMTNKERDGLRERVKELEEEVKTLRGVSYA